MSKKNKGKNNPNNSKPNNTPPADHVWTTAGGVNVGDRLVLVDKQNNDKKAYGKVVSIQPITQEIVETLNGLLINYELEGSYKYGTPPTGRYLCLPNLPMQVHRPHQSRVTSAAKSAWERIKGWWNARTEDEVEDETETPFDK